MDIDSAVNADSHTFEFTEIAPHTRDTDGSCTTECVSGDWSAEVKQENLADVKQEPDDVRCVLCVMFCLSKQMTMSADDS